MSRHARRLLLGGAFIAHGLAHAGAGTWAAASGPSWLVTPLWVISMAGFIGAGFGLLGTPGLVRRWERLAVAATVASLILLLLWSHLALMIGMALDAAVLAAGLRWGEVALHDDPPQRSRAHRVARAVGTAAAWGVLAWSIAAVALRPWFLNWGTTPAERAMRLPGDELTPVANYRIDHGVTIRAPADSVWPWLAQLGQDRGGFYSYDHLERAIGARIRNADRIHPEWQRRAAGDFVRAAPPGYLGGIFGDAVGWRVVELLPGRAMILDRWGAFVLQPVDSTTTRLLVRTRGDGAPSVASAALAPVGVLVFEPAHFIMERGMLLGIKRRAERMVASR